MSDTNANAAPRKRAKLSDQSPTGRNKADVYASEEMSSGAAQNKHNHEDKPSAEDDDTEECSASAQVWNTTELLEHIISYLPGKSMVVVSGVNKMAYNCVANSSIAQSKLFMRPSGREEDRWMYCEFYDPRTFTFDSPNDIVAQSFELISDTPLQIKNAGVPNAVARGWVTMVDLCPLLELDDAQESAALGRLKRKGWQDDERANLTGLPTESTRYNNMILTDPPVNAVGVKLTYKHSLWPSLRIQAKRHIKSKSGPLTIGAALRSACTGPGTTYLHEPRMPSNNYGRSHACLQNSTVDNVILQTVREHGGSFTLDLKDSQFVFWSPRIVVPSLEERMDMEAYRAEWLLEPTLEHQG